MPSRTLLAYVTAGGATERYAHVIADALRSHGQTVDVVDLKRQAVADLSAYDNVVVGAGVRIAMVYRKAKSFLVRKDLRGKRIAVYLSSAMAVADPDKAKARFLTPFMEKHGLAPVMYDAFPGIVPGAGGKLADRTDADRARRWAEELAGRLGDAAARENGHV